MAYQKTIWSSNDLITAAKLNNLEEGVETLDEKIGNFEGDISEQIEINITNIAENTEDIGDLTTQVNTLSSQINTINGNLSTNISNLQATDTTLSNRIDTLENKTGVDGTYTGSTLEARITALEGDTTNTTQNQLIASLQSQINGISISSVNYKGAYTLGISYAQNDIVSYTDSGTTTYYICINTQGTTGASGAPGSDWALFPIPSQLDGLVYYGADTTNVTDNAILWVKSQSSNPSVIDDTETEIITTDDFNNLIKEYSNSDTYTIGDYVTYKNASTNVKEVYKCKSNINIEEDWTPSHWTKIILSEDINSSYVQLDTLETLLVNKGTLVTGSNLNNLITNAIYLLIAGGEYITVPSNFTSGFITVKAVGTIVQQTIETATNIYLRQFNGTDWSEWVEK